MKWIFGVYVLRKNMCEWYTTRWRQTITKTTRTRRSSSFQWNVNTLHNDVECDCPSGKINNTSLAQIHHYMVLQIQSLYLYENVFCCLFIFYFFYPSHAVKDKNWVSACSLIILFYLWNDWVSDNANKAQAHAYTPQGQGHWVSLTF